MSVEVLCLLLCGASSRLVEICRLGPEASSKPKSTPLFMFPYLSDGVGDIVEGQGGWLRAEGGVLRRRIRTRSRKFPTTPLAARHNTKRRILTDRTPGHHLDHHRLPMHRLQASVSHPSCLLLYLVLSANQPGFPSCTQLTFNSSDGQGGGLKFCQSRFFAWCCDGR